ncbi:MAG: DNA polymerase III subunit delta [Candidatus Tumulicola sp.]
MRFYDFADKQPAIGKLVIIEGTERELADRALDLILDRLLPAEVRDLNLQRFGPEDVGDASRVREAAQAMPFLAERRVTVVTDAQTLKAQPRRDLWAVAQEVPEGNTLVIADLLAPKSTRPQAYGALAGRTALRVDTTATEDARARFVEETLRRLDVKAEVRVVDALVRSAADLASVRNDLEKLALGGKTITLRELERESLSIEDPKAYKYASALVEGRLADALEIAHECFAGEPRNALIPLLSALATECGYLWELARPGGELPERARWRERTLRPLARRVGERRARIAYERAVRGIEAMVTGRAGSDPDEHRTLVERISVELSGLSSRPRRAEPAQRY